MACTERSRWRYPAVGIVWMVNHDVYFLSGKGVAENLGLLSAIYSIID